MIRRIDLRGSHAPEYRDVVPRADFDVEAALEVVRPICDAVRRRGVEAINEFTARFDGVEQTDIAVPRAAMTAALGRARPPGARRPGGVDPPASGDLRGRARAGRHHRGRARWHRQPADGGGRTRRALRARRGRPARVQRGDERRAGAGRRRRLDRAHVVAACRVRRPAAPDDPRRVRAARRRGGLRRRRRAGHRDVRLWRRAVPQGRPGDRPGQHLHGLREAAPQGRRRHRLRGRPDRDRDPRRRQRGPRPRRGRPAQPGRARHRWPRPCW